jgi:hypothetical protein
MTFIIHDARPKVRKLIGINNIDSIGLIITRSKERMHPEMKRPVNPGESRKPGKTELVNHRAKTDTNHLFMKYFMYHVLYQKMT